MQSMVQSVKELRSTHSKGLEVPCQNTFKDKPAFINRLIKVLVARNLFSVHSSSCRNNRLTIILMGQFQQSAQRTSGGSKTAINYYRAIFKWKNGRLTLRFSGCVMDNVFHQIYLIVGGTKFCSQRKYGGELVVSCPSAVFNHRNSPASSHK